MQKNVATIFFGTGGCVTGRVFSIIELNIVCFEVFATRPNAATQGVAATTGRCRVSSGLINMRMVSGVSR